MSSFCTAQTKGHSAVFQPSQQSPPSTFYTLLPSAFRSRIPVLRSIRQSAGFALPAIGRPRTREASISKNAAANGRESFSSASTVVSSEANTPLRPGTPELTNDTLAFEMSTARPQRGEPCSGVDWNVAGAGVRLWISARSQAEQRGDALALRSMHIDALRYMHMALPPDLTPVEVESLRSSFSPQILDQPRIADHVQGSTRPNALRQSVSRVVCWIVATILFLLPLLMTLMNRALQYERQHQLTERVITNGVDLTSSLGERGVDLQNAITRFRDGRIGGACLDLASWILESVVGGVNDGLAKTGKIS